MLHRERRRGTGLDLDHDRSPSGGRLERREPYPSSAKAVPAAPRLGIREWFDLRSHRSLWSQPEGAPSRLECSLKGALRYKRPNL
jgi:hypothetical protein